ncbi:LamG-like jellyroll fold domain-containing protein [Cumulibacter manganitolerans]|uniref:LamG-like jellyroll fold domain-containing protein n=1 Tax=Cumulibacter manganitolerans TaxID=1884992 RepID=UPI001295BF55|nr:LamG-like jellyroll fold domain-containing protein [Cumulibacter manganitolerans]
MSSDDADATAERRVSTSSRPGTAGQISDATDAPGDGHGADVEPLGGIVAPPVARPAHDAGSDDADPDANELGGATENDAETAVAGSTDETRAVAETDDERPQAVEVDDEAEDRSAEGDAAHDGGAADDELPGDADTYAADSDDDDDPYGAVGDRDGDRGYDDRSERSIWGTDDEDDGYTYVRRSDPNWDLSKWLLVGAVAAVFVLLSFLMIPKLFTPAVEEAASSSAKPPAPASSAPEAVAAKSYRDLVLGSGPTHYWQFAYGSDPSADAVGTSNLTLGKDVSMLGSSAVKGQSGAIDCTATNRSVVNSQTPETPTGDYTLEAWVNTTSPDGGQILSFGNKATGASSKVDRTLYIDTAGLAYVATRTQSKRYFAASETIVTDGKWHHIVGTMSGSSGLTLYVDGVQVAAEAKGTSATEFEGFWRICGDSLSGWPRAAKTALIGSIDEVAVYNRALAPDEVKAHYAAAS